MIREDGKAHFHRSPINGELVENEDSVPLFFIIMVKTLKFYAKHVTKNKTFILDFHNLVVKNKQQSKII